MDPLSPQINKSPVKWYLRPVSIIIAILAVGPFAIPLIWLSPSINRWLKMALTIITILLTIWMINASVEMLQILLREMKNLQDVLK